MGTDGGPALPIGMKSMQNTTFLALLKPIFAVKGKIPSPIGIENVSTLAMGLKRTRSQKLTPAWEKTLFFVGIYLTLDTKLFQFQVKTVLVWLYTRDGNRSGQDSSTGRSSR